MRKTRSKTELSKSIMINVFRYTKKSIEIMIKAGRLFSKAMNEFDKSMSKNLGVSKTGELDIIGYKPSKKKQRKDYSFVTGKQRSISNKPDYSFVTGSSNRKLKF